MKNVKVILLLSVILSFIYFIKINEGFGPFDLYNYLTGDDTGTGTGTATAGTGTATAGTGTGAGPGAEGSTVRTTEYCTRR